MSMTSPLSIGSIGQPMGPTRGRIGGLTGTLAYPSPFFDVAQTYLPTSMKHMFRFCRYFVLTNGLLAATVFKLSEYPVTDLIIDHEHPVTRDRWMEYFHDHLRYRSFQVECGLDFFTYGNCFVSVSFPFHKYLTCAVCGFSDRALRIKNRWTFSNYEFRLTCPKCQETANAHVFDHYVKNASAIRLIRWNPEDIEIVHNETTGESVYYYSIPGTLKNDILIGKKDIVASTQQIFIQAVRQQKGIILSKDNLYHHKRPCIAWQDRGWGIPLILPVLKDTFYLQIMKKAQEAILLEHIVPLRTVFPQPASGTSDPFTTVSLIDWKAQVSEEIARWRYDNNYIPVMPIPIGQQSIGGDGKALLLFNEMQALTEHIMMGMGFPRELLQGGLSYSGTNVSLRMMENFFIGYNSGMKAMTQWVMKMVAYFMGWPVASPRMKPFKMADDIQRKMYLFQLNQAKIGVSDTTLLSDVDLNPEDEMNLISKESVRKMEAMKKEQIAMAEIQGEAQVIMMKMQAKAQETLAMSTAAPVAPGEPGDSASQSIPAAAQSQLTADQVKNGSGNGVRPDLLQTAQMYARQLSASPPAMQEQWLASLRAQSPELAQLVQQFMSQQGQQDTSSNQSVDMRPLPEQRAPRRTLASV